jgi:hypothetical protein
MRRPLLALLLASTALADDGGAAPSTRWSHARGPASSNGVSRAQPPESFGSIAWSYKAKDAILATPVVWDGAVFVVDGSDKKADLVALDAETGQVWARAPVKGAGQPAVFQRNAFLVEGGKTLVQFRLAGRTLTREWTFEAPGLSAPRVIDGEIYATTPLGLLSLSPGSNAARWKAEGAFTGEPAVRDGHVYAMRRDESKLLLCAYARADGKEAASVVLSETAPRATGGRVAVGGAVIGALLPPEQERAWAVVSRQVKDGTPELRHVRTQKFLTDPLAGQMILLGVAPEPRAWLIVYANDKQPSHPLVSAKDRPELLESPGGCIWLGEACQCYGNWCGDLNSNIVYWHALERPDGAPLRKGLRFDPVPARDERVLLVPQDGKSILALAPEEVR